MLGEDELYPVIYVTSSGKYECVVSIQDHSLLKVIIQKV